LSSEKKLLHRKNLGSMMKKRTEVSFFAFSNIKKKIWLLRNKKINNQVFKV
jgi:hypothetical protein